MTDADRKLENMRSGLYKAAGLSNAEPDALFAIARSAGVDAWDLTVITYGNGYGFSWTPDGIDNPVHVLVPKDLDGADDVLRQAAKKYATGASGVEPSFAEKARTVYAANRPGQEAMAKFIIATSATGDAGATQLDRIEAKLDRLISKYAKD